MSVDEAIVEYQSLAQHIFDEPIAAQTKGLLKDQARFSATKLEEAFKDVIRRRSHSKQADETKNQRRQRLPIRTTAVVECE